MNGSISELVPSSWTRRTLGDLGSWTGGATPSKANSAFWGGAIPWVSPKDMKAFVLGGAQDAITDQAVEESAVRIFPANSIAFVTRSGILEHTLPIALIPFPATCNQDIKVLTPQEGVDERWLLNALLGVAPDIRRACQKDGTTVASIDFAALKAYELPVPPLDVQRQLSRRADGLAQSVAAAADRAGEASARIRLLRFAALKRMLELAESQSRPRPLESIVEILDRHRVPVNRKEREERLGDVPYYGATGQVGWIDEFLFDEELVLLGEDGVSFLDPFAAKAYRISGKSWVNNHAHVLRADPEEVRADYLTHALNAFDYRGLVGGTTRLKLTQADMKKIRLPVPGIDRQLELVENLDAALQAAATAAVALESVGHREKQLRGSIRAAMVEGTLDVDV